MNNSSRFLLLFLMLSVATFTFAQTGEFNHPWTDPSTAIVLDPFQGNSINWDKVATDPRVVGVVHRGTIGLRKDTLYKSRRDEAKRRGYKWGSYHLGKPGNPIVQADFYLTTIAPTDDEVMALDIESLDEDRDMNLANARRFIQHIKEKTGRYPMLYANHAVVKAVSQRFPHDEVFSKAPLWYARFKSQVTDFPTATWATYTLWQFSSEINCTPAHPEKCLYRVPGTKTDMDVNVYRGSVADLKASWPFKQE
jgi:GH25 family lysozyme M1 (1,4-beta-N-acetylmuramidase)